MLDDLDSNPKYSKEVGGHPWHFRIRPSSVPIVVPVSHSQQESRSSFNKKVMWMNPSAVPPVANRADRSGQAARQDHARCMRRYVHNAAKILRSHLSHAMAGRSIAAIATARLKPTLNKSIWTEAGVSRPSLIKIAPFYVLCRDTPFQFYNSLQQDGFSCYRITLNVDG